MKRDWDSFRGYTKLNHEPQPLGNHTLMVDVRRWFANTKEKLTNNTGIINQTNFDGLDVITKASADFCQ